MIVTFIGHGRLSIDDDLKTKITKEIENCIKSGADTFYLGHYGQFDYFCAHAVKNLKDKYPSIKSFFITPYITQGYQENLKFIKEQDLYDDIIYPEIENVPYRFAISKRNEYMVLCKALHNTIYVKQTVM